MAPIAIGVPCWKLFLPVRSGGHNGLCFCNHGNFTWIYFSLNIHIQYVAIMLQIPEGLQMGSKQAAGEYAIPAGIEFIFWYLFPTHISPLRGPWPASMVGL